MTEDLKEKLRQAKNAEEAKQAIDNHKDELSDDDLESVAGGTLFFSIDSQCEIARKSSWCYCQ